MRYLTVVPAWSNGLPWRTAPSRARKSGRGPGPDEPARRQLGFRVRHRTRQIRPSPVMPAGTCFGYGAHQCIGANLARVEMQIALSSLVRRLPGLQLAVPVEQLRFQNQQEIFGVEALPVTW